MIQLYIIILSIVCGIILYGDILNNSVFLKKYGNTEIEIRDIDKYLKEESFCIPEDQELPSGHFEFKLFIVDGIIRIGKTSLTTKYLANKAYEVWLDDIDFFIADDLYGLVYAIAHSETPVHFVVLDDQINYLDARDPFGNKKLTQIFYKIAHELQDECIRRKGNLGGIVICALLVQSLRAVDLRIRKDFSMFTILKSHDELACKMYEINEEIQDELKDWQVRSKRLTDYEARKHAFIVDEQKKGCFIEFDSTDPKWKDLPFKFKIIEGIDRYRDQRNLLVDYLSSFQLDDYTINELKGEILYKLDELEKKGEIIYVTRNDLSEIIWRAKRNYKHIKEKETYKIKILGINGIFNVTCPNCGNHQKYQPRDLHIIFNNPRVWCKLCGKIFYINKNELFVSRELEESDKESQVSYKKEKGMI
ncbi:MAG: hypothetical protein ACFE8A_13475 [Candidatus Hodarchaeota archaeon]